MNPIVNTIAIVNAVAFVQHFFPLYELASIAVNEREKSIGLGIGRSTMMYVGTNAILYTLPIATIMTMATGDLKYQTIHLGPYFGTALATVMSYNSNYELLDIVGLFFEYIF